MGLIYLNVLPIKLPQSVVEFVNIKTFAINYNGFCLLFYKTYVLSALFLLRNAYIIHTQQNQLTHRNLCYYVTGNKSLSKVYDGEVTKIILQLSSNYLHFCSSGGMCRKKIYQIIWGF